MPDLTSLCIYDSVAELVLRDHSRRNALSTRMIEAINSDIDEATRAGAGVLIIRGEEDFFCAGADLNELTGTSPDARHDALIGSTAERLHTSPLVTIAAIERGAVGAGCELALACDIRVGDPSTYFSFPALSMGLIYRPSTLHRVVGLLGHTTATKLLLCGERIEMPEAERLGLVTKPSDSGGVRDMALEIGRSLAETHSPEQYIGTARILAEAIPDGPVAANRWRAHHASFSSEHRREAVATHKRSVKENK